MTITEERMVTLYEELIDGLSVQARQALLDRLSKTVKADQERRKKAFFSSFGAFSDKQSAEEIIRDLKVARSFRDKDILF